MRNVLKIAALAGALLGAGCAPAAVPAAVSDNAPGLATAPNDTAAYTVVPYPRSLEPLGGGFVLSGDTRIVPPQPAGTEMVALVERWAEPLRAATGLPLPIAPAGDEAAAPGAIRLRLDPAAGYGNAEGYRLAVLPGGVEVAAPQPAGLFYGLQTLRQLLPPPADQEEERLGSGSAPAIPAVRIEDAPRFPYRGMHLDVSRHFFSTDYLKRFIDYLALYKFNRFHLHLTDDQGWRLEIKRHPELTEQGGWRAINDQDREVLSRGRENPDFFHLPEEHFRTVGGERRYGGFYTRDEMREVIEYAAARQITIVPEIDMPGHMMAAIAAYPELSCTGEPAWGETFSVPLCPGKEEVYTFVENIIDEVTALFPGEYIHIGGDEVEKSTWANHAGSRALMQREGLQNVEELQSYFIHRVEKMLNERGKKMIGWDEIIEGGLSPTATVMYWRGWAPNAPVEAARHGNDVIMSPTHCCYFDAEETAESLPYIYRVEPVPAGLSAEEARHIIGVQANLWSEYIPTPAQVEYMAFPRMLALAEVAWTPPAQRDWPEFQDRLAAHYPRLDAMGVHYRVPPLPGLHPRSVFTRDTTLSLAPPVPGVELRYTTDGTVPTHTSSPRSQPIRVSGDVEVKVRPFYPSGLGGAVQTFHLERQEPRAADTPGALQPGLRADYYPVGVISVHRIGGTPERGEVAPELAVPEASRAAAFGMIFTGYVRVPADGVYTFSVASDDGSVLYIGDRLVVDNDGPHSRRALAGQVALHAGLHPVRLLFFEGGGGHSLQVEWEGPGVEPGPVPADALFHRPSSPADR